MLKLATALFAFATFVLAHVGPVHAAGAVDDWEAVLCETVLPNNNCLSRMTVVDPASDYVAPQQADLACEFFLPLIVWNDPVIQGVWLEDVVMGNGDDVCEAFPTGLQPGVMVFASVDNTDPNFCLGAGEVNVELAMVHYVGCVTLPMPYENPALDGTFCEHAPLP